MSERRAYSGPVEALTLEEARKHAEAIDAWMTGEIKSPATPEPILPDDWNGHWVYLIAATDDLVKLGISRDPDARLASLQSGHHTGLRLLATVAGFLEDEQALHRLLAKHRVRGEWFRVGPWLEAFMVGAHAGENAGLILKRLEARKP